MSSKSLKQTPLSKFIDKVKVGSCIKSHQIYDWLHYDKIVDGVNFKYIRCPTTGHVLYFAGKLRKVYLKVTKSQPCKNPIEALQKIVSAKRKQKTLSHEDWMVFAGEKAVNTLISYTGCGSGKVKENDKKGQLDWFIQEIKKIPKDKTKVFYRGMWWKDKKARTEFVKKLEKGGLLQIDCITSVSKKKNIAESFSGIHAPNHKGVFMKIHTSNAYPNRHNDWEHEYFLLKGQEFLVKDIKKPKTPKKVVEIVLVEKPKKKSLAVKGIKAKCL